MIEEESEDFDISSNYVTGETEQFGSSGKTNASSKRGTETKASPSDLQPKKSTFALTIKEIEEKERNQQYRDNKKVDDDENGSEEEFQSEDKFGDLIKNIVKKSNNENLKKTKGLGGNSEAKNLKIKSPNFGVANEDTGIQEGHQSVHVDDINLESRFNTQGNQYDSINTKNRFFGKNNFETEINKMGRKSVIDLDNVLPSMDNSFSDQFSSSQHITNPKKNPKNSQNFSKEKNIHNHFGQNLNYHTLNLKSGLKTNNLDTNLNTLEDFQSQNFKKRQKGVIDLREFESDFSTNKTPKIPKSQNFNSNFDNGEVKIEDYQEDNNANLNYQKEERQYQQKENFNNLKFTSEHDQNSLKFQSQNFENYDLTNYMEFTSGKKRYINEHQDILNSLMSGLKEGGMAPEPSDEEYFSKSKKNIFLFFRF